MSDILYIVEDEESDELNMEDHPTLPPVNSSDDEIDHATELEYDDSSCTYDLMEDPDLI